MKPSVYLAGPIAGLNYEGSTNWRESTKKHLSARGVSAFSPMRAKEYLSHVQSFDKDCDGYSALSVLSSNRGIITRDRHDATKCDVILANLLGAERVSIGTVMELAWADAHRIPIVVVMEPSGNVHDHGMLNEVTGFRVPTLDQAIDICAAILTP